MIVTANDFNDWKANNVTKAFYEACQLRIEEAKEILATTAGINSSDDSYMRGFIKAYTEMFGFRFEDVEEVSNND